MIKKKMIIPPKYRHILLLWNFNLTIIIAKLRIFSVILFVSIFNIYFQIGETSLVYANDPSKQEIQAAMIIKFTDFIEWPSGSFDINSKYFTIAIVGENEYQGLFEPFIDRKFYGKTLKVVHYASIENIYTDIDNKGNVQILIVSQSEKKRIKPLLDRVKDKPILTIGDFPGFASNGGILNFFRKANNRIGFEINMESKNSSGIKISSHLLKLGKIVGEQNNGWLKNKKEKP